MGGIKLGLDGVIYLNNGGTVLVPVWLECQDVKDVNINLEKGEADLTTRKNNGWRARRGTLKDGSVEFDMLQDLDDPAYNILQRAFLLNQQIEVCAMNGDVTKPGASGLRAMMDVMSFSEAQPLEDGIGNSVKLAPTPAAVAPYWYVTEAIDGAEPTTPAGANLYWDAVNSLATFTEGTNDFIGVTVADYTTAGTIVFYDSTAEEV